jgi:fatty acid synthase subunit alpha
LTSLFTQFAFERLIEVGPFPTLTGMASRTLKAKYEARDDSVTQARSILCHAKHEKKIYYQFEDEPDVHVVEAPPAAALPVPTITPPVVQAAVLSTPPNVAAVSIGDGPIKAIDILSVLIAQKLKKRVDEIPLSKTIKDLVGRKITLQKEISRWNSLLRLKKAKNYLSRN